MDSDYLGPFSVLIVVLAGVLALLAGAVAIVAARSAWRKWESKFDSTGRRLALVAEGVGLEKPARMVGRKAWRRLRGEDYSGSQSGDVPRRRRAS